MAEQIFGSKLFNKIKAVDSYIVDALHPADADLDSTLKANARSSLNAIDVSPVHGKLLYLLAKITNAKRILEFGTLGGYSAIWFAKALPKGGKLITCELEPKHAQVAQSNIDNAGLTDKVEIRLGPALETIERMGREGVEDFDMVFIDADKENNAAYFKFALEHSHSGTVIVVDNVVRRGSLVDEEQQSSQVVGVRNMFEWLKTEKRVECTAVQTLGSKGWDGMVLARVL
ncbi:O-methyltransferase MdmC [Lachnellula suecica]|uniref:O-methyltransferase MdmC n=1 Tax=Lachnellula suecica TaxID=602035 RepID=A0A8T9C1E5_9HELO|nr:O-methyltransferase MdmC [Lachnellula suecica]